MKDWKVAILIVALLSASPFIVICDDCSVNAETTVSPKIVKVEYNSLEDSYLKVTTDVNFGLRVCQYEIKDSKGVIQLHGPSVSSSNFFKIDTAVATAGYLADDSFSFYFDNRTVPYTFDIYKLTFNGNGTALKTSSVHLSTDSLSTYPMPTGFIWNTERDGSGAWISDLTSVDFVDNAATLYAFKGNNIGISISSSTSTVTAGSDAIVLVNLDGNAGIAEIDLTIEYDNTVLTLEKVTSGDFLPMGKTSISNYPFTAVLKTNENIRTVGNLLRLVFSVDSSAEMGQYPVKVTVTASEDMYGKVLPNTVSGCAVTVGERIRGDLSGNGEIDNADAAMLMNRLANIPTGLDDSEFDLNGDGEINALDSLIMMKYLSNVPISFADSADEGVVMTVSSGDATSTVDGIQSGKNVYIDDESATSVTASSASGNIAVTKVADGRFVLVAPASDFTVKVN